MTQQDRGGQGALENVEASLEGGFEWLEKNRRVVGIGITASLVIAGLIAIGVEWSSRKEANGQMAVSAVDDEYLEAMGASPGSFEAPEPANADQATQAREVALAGYEAISQDYGSQTAGSVAALRAAEIELGLGQGQAAVERLAALVDDIGADSMLGATANRLLGYAHEKLGDPGAAAKAYEAAGLSERYPGRETSLLAAAETYLRAGDNASAVRAFQALREVDAEYATSIGVDTRLEALGVTEIE